MCTGEHRAGVNDLRFDDDSLGDPNSRVYEIVRCSTTSSPDFPVPVADGNVHYSIGRRSYGSFRVANCEFFLLDTRGARQMRYKPSASAKPHHARNGPAKVAHGKHGQK